MVTSHDNALQWPNDLGQIKSSQIYWGLVAIKCLMCAINYIVDCIINLRCIRQTEENCPVFSDLMQLVDLIDGQKNIPKKVYLNSKPKNYMV